MTNRYIVGLLLGLAFGLIMGPVVIYFSKRLKFKQTILHYVDKHAGKSGTPTMGGVAFIVSAIISSLFIVRGNFTLGIISLATMFSYGVLGFLDDYIKVRYKQNEGLRPYQKIIGQVGIAIIIAVFCYFSPLVGTEIYFFNLVFDIGWFIIPFVIVVFIATTNSVNLIDGLDGLCAGVSISYFISFASVIMLSGELGTEMGNVISIIFVFVGALVAFMLFNVYPAKIFMGDTGSMAIGGFVAITAVFLKNPFLIPIIGIMYVITAVSDIIQVFYYKRTKKRVFLMAPIHHHFEKKGASENHIVFAYIVITAVVGIMTYMVSIYLK